MRSIKELLELMLQHQDLFVSGLCYWAGMMYCHGRLISYNEYIILEHYINKNRPHKYSSLEAYIQRYRGYYWEVGNIHPRIKWIKKHIKKNK